MNKKISTSVSIIIILACAVLVGGVAVWQYFEMPKIEISEFNLTEKTQPEDETADWMLYSNEEVGIEFKYPADWYYDESLNPRGAGVGEGVKLITNFFNYPVDRNVYISEDTDQAFFLKIIDLSNKDRAEEELNNFAKLTDDDSYSRIIIDGNEGYEKIVVCKECPGFEKGRTYGYFYIVNDKYLYEINFIAEVNAISPENNFNQIISTLKFIK